VRWESICGFKRRAPVAAKIVDHGDDGAVVEDGGKRSFVAGLYPPGYRLPDALDPVLVEKEKPLAKSAIALLFTVDFPDLLKAMKSWPGPSLYDVRIRNRWSRLLVR
jgi:hypothetical protein